MNKTVLQNIAKTVEKGQYMNLLSLDIEIRDLDLKI